MPSPYAGTVLKVHFKEKDLVKVGQVLVTIGRGARSSCGGAPAPAEAAGSPAVGQLLDRRRGGASVPGGSGEVLALPRSGSSGQGPGVGPRAASPAPARAVAITEEDVRAATSPGGRKEAGGQGQGEIRSLRDLERIPLRGVRRATAKKMQESVDDGRPRDALRRSGRRPSKSALSPGRSAG